MGAGISFESLICGIVLVHAIHSKCFYIKDAKPAARVTRMSFAFNDEKTNVFSQIWDGIISVSIASTAFPIGLAFRDLTTCTLDHTIGTLEINTSVQCEADKLAERFGLTVGFVVIVTLVLVYIRKWVREFATWIGNKRISAKINGWFAACTPRMCFDCEMLCCKYKPCDVLTDQQWYELRALKSECCNWFYGGPPNVKTWKEVVQETQAEEKKKQIEVICHCDCTQKQTETNLSDAPGLIFSF